MLLISLILLSSLSRKDIDNNLISLIRIQCHIEVKSRDSEVKHKRESQTGNLLLV